MRVAILTGLGFVTAFFVSCSPNNVEEDNSLKKYFDEHKVAGTFAFYSNSSGNFKIYELNRYKDSAYLPASTFKIANSLIGIETGRVNNDSTVIEWNGQPSRIVACNENLPMYKAFRNSCVPWFQELARRIGKDVMQKELDSLGYGQRYGKPIIKRIDSFWLDNSLKVTADEQLGLVKRLYFQKLPFQPRTQRLVKQMMLMEDNSNYKLSYKTGWGHRENGNSIGWIVGWIEENRHPYFFVLQIETADPNADIVSIRMKMLKDILGQYGFFQGTK